MATETPLRLPNWNEAVARSWRPAGPWTSKLALQNYSITKDSNTLNPTQRQVVDHLDSMAKASTIGEYQSYRAQAVAGGLPENSLPADFKDDAQFSAFKNQLAPLIPRFRQGLFGNE
jgi:hypothetical protein